LRKLPYTSYNPFFFIPFTAWLLIGGIFVATLDKQSMFEPFNIHHTPVSDVIVHNTTHMGEGGFIAVVLLLLFAFAALRNWWFFTTALLCNVLPSFVIQLVKRWYHAPRPLTYFHNAGWIHIEDNWERLYHDSFPSGHSAGAFSLFCFLSMLLPKAYRAWGLLFFVLGLCVCYSRMYLAAHFFEDVYAGSVIGTLTTLAVFSVMRRFRPSFATQTDSLTFSDS